MDRLSSLEINRIKIFSSLSPAKAEEIAVAFERHVYRARDTIIYHGDLSTDVMVVLQGSVKATIYAHNGREISIREIGPGEIFGDYSAIDNNSRSADVVAISDAVIGVISAADFVALVTTIPEVSLLQMRELTSMIRHLTNRIVEVSTLTASFRIQAEIVRLVRGHRSEQNSAIISPSPTHAEIAAAVSTQREVVTRELKRLEDLGFIDRRSGNLVVHNLAALEIMSNTNSQLHEPLSANPRS